VTLRRRRHCTWRVVRGAGGGDRPGGGHGGEGAASRRAGARDAVRAHHTLRDVPAVEERLVAAGGFLHERVEHVHDLAGAGQLLGEARCRLLDPHTTLRAVVRGGAHLVRRRLETVEEVRLPARVDEDLGVGPRRLRHAVGECAQLLEGDLLSRERELHELGRVGELEPRDLHDRRHVITEERRAGRDLDGERALPVPRVLVLLGHRRGELADGLLELLLRSAGDHADECRLIVVEKATRVLERGQLVSLLRLHCPILR
jgi:hypothetical protein